MRRLREHLSLGDECVSPFSLSPLYLIPLLMNILQSLQSGSKQTVQERRNKQEVNLAVGNGSKVRVQCNEYAWEYAGKAGKGLDLQAVQIVDLIEYKAEDGSEFFDEGEEF